DGLEFGDSLNLQRPGSELGCGQTGAGFVPSSLGLCSCELQTSSLSAVRVARGWRPTTCFWCDAGVALAFTPLRRSCVRDVSRDTTRRRRAAGSPAATRRAGAG